MFVSWSGIGEVKHCLMIKMGCQDLNLLTKDGIVDDVHVHHDPAMSSDSSEASSVVSSDSDLMDSEDESCSATSSFDSSGELAAGTLLDMSSLKQQLPFKRGLSKYFQGKSQSFTSLSSVMSLEDLAKPENPYNKRLKSCKSYAGLKAADSHFSTRRSSSSHLPRADSSSRFISKKTSSTRVSCSSLSAKRNTSSSSFTGISRPPIPPPHGSTGTSSFSNQTPLFA